MQSGVRINMDYNLKHGFEGFMQNISGGAVAPDYAI